MNFKTFQLDGANTQTGIEIADSTLQEGQGMHGSLSRADTFNNMAAMAPDFKTGFVDSTPMSNADIVPTMAKVMNIDLPFTGNLPGRVLWEALRGNTNTRATSRGVAVNGVGANGSRRFSNIRL